MKYFSQSMTLMGTVTNVDPAEASFTLRCRSGDSFQIQASCKRRSASFATWMN